MGRLEIYLIAFIALTTLGATRALSWCPYKVEKIVPCKIRNGTEPYTTTICYQHGNGSKSCSLQVMYKPKFVTVQKKLVHIRYRWDPNCNLDKVWSNCAGCSDIPKLKDDIKKLRKLVEDLRTEVDWTNRLDNDYILRKNIIENSLFPPSEEISKVSDEEKKLKSHIDALLNISKDTERRLSLLEDEMRIVREKKLEMLITKAERKNLNSSTEKAVSEINETQNMIKSLKIKAEELKEAESTKAFKVLEDNLDRGDIASTLNDDYGEDLLVNTSEEYEDQLKALIE